VQCREESLLTVVLRKGKANMGLRALPLTPLRSNFPSNFGVAQDLCNYRFNKAFKFTVSAKTEKGEKEEPKKSNQSLFSNITEALDFSQVRSAEDAELLAEAREATKSGEKMTREQVTLLLCVYLAWNSSSLCILCLCVDKLIWILDNAYCARAIMTNNF
jgi:hypothetical protein